MTTSMGDFDRGGRLAIAVVLLGLALGTNVLGAGLLFWLALAAGGVPSTFGRRTWGSA